MNQAKRHEMRKKYEARDQERKNARLGIKPRKQGKKKGRK